MKTQFLHDRDETDLLFPEKRVDCHFTGVFDEALDFIMRTQLMRADLWRKFVSLYRLQPDASRGWSGEYWGKMMRGACWVCDYSHDEALYALLRESVLDIIACAEPNGRISTYAQALEFRGWDMWCRKYVLLGLEYFYEICPEQELRETIKSAMMRHLDYIIERVGNGVGQVPICKTSDFWKGANSASILEPTVRLWRLTGKGEYLAFADYIVQSGACDGEESLFELAYRDELPPFRYPVAKAYETMSCFEGLIEFYRVTREEKWRTAALNFGRRICKLEKSIIGCCGCTEELFDGGALRQTATPPYWIMQETCVTVTWMKLALQLLRLSGDASYADHIEESFYNAYLGALNTREIPSLAKRQSDGLNAKHPEDLRAELLTFDSYSPLLPGVRGQLVGGHNVMPDGSFYGCCACIGSAGLGLLPKAAVMHSAAGPVIDLYLPGEMTVATPSGQALKLAVETTYPYGDGKVAITLSMDHAERFALTLRVPAWSKETVLTLNGEPLTLDGAGYQSFEREWQTGDRLLLTLDLRVQIVAPPVGSCNEEAFNAYRRGPIVLAADARTGDDPSGCYAVEADRDGIVTAAAAADCAEIPEHRVCVALPTANGGMLRLVDYSSAGKTWSEDSRCAVWLRNGNLL